MACEQITGINAALTFAAGNFPSDYCPASYSALAQDIASALTGSLPGNFTSWNVGSNVPSNADRDKPWLRLDGANCAPLGVYEWSTVAGAWVSRHPDFVGKVVMWEGDIGTIDTLDGGEAGAITTFTGPMWQKVSQMDARFPVGPGTSPGFQTTPVPTVIPIGGTGGVDGTEITIGSTQLPAHIHDITVESTGASGGDSATSEAGRFQVSDGTFKWVAANANDRVGHTRSTGEEPADIDPIEIPGIPRYYAIWFIKRTSRLYYRI